MIKPKPRAKPVKAGEGDSGGDRQKNSSAPSAVSKKRRPSQKKKEDEDSSHHSSSKKRSGGPLSIHSAALLHQEEHRRYYQRAPRLLPDIDGVQSLSSSEIQSDLKHLTASLAVFEAKLGTLGVTGAGGYVHGSNPESASLDLEAAYEFMFQKRRARPNGVITPEEVVESLPVCRRAVRITQRELAAMKRERDDLERDFMRQRCKLLWQLGEMKRIQKQQDKVLKVLRQDVVHKAKGLESSRRRTNALQDIMTELDARGSAVLRLAREKQQLVGALSKHGLAAPEPEDIYVGDRVALAVFGHGTVEAMDDKSRTLTVTLDWGATAFVQEEQVEVLPSVVVYTEAEKELKSRLFDKIGALVELSGTAGGGGRGSGGGRRRGSRVDESDEDMDVVEDEEEEEEDEEEEEEEDEDREGESDASDSDAPLSRPSKKRRLMVAPAAKKKAKPSSKVLDFTAGKLPITPYDAGLIISPLSVLPERVAAAAPVDLQWMSGYLPSKMVEWEQERYAALQMQGEIERLQFQLRQAQAEKEDAQALAVEQVDSINELVRQVEKLREQSASSRESKEKEKESSTSAGTGSASGDVCPSCAGSGSASPGPAKKPAVKAPKANGKPATKASNRRQRGESISAADDEDEPHDAEPHEDGAAQDEDEFGEDGESSDTSKPTARSLRPRRASSDKPAASGNGPSSKPAK